MPDETAPAGPPLGAMTDDTGPLGVPWSFPAIEPAPAEPSGSLLGAAAHASPLQPPAPDLSFDQPAPAVEDTMHVPRRVAAGAGPVSPARALAGAAVAVSGVLLGIGALLWATDAPTGSPAVQQAQSAPVTTSAAASPSPARTAGPEPGTTSAAAPLPGPAESATAAPKLALTVLNNSRRTGLAARAARSYAAAGWPIKLTGGFRGRITATTVYYAPGEQASAQLLQHSFPAIERVRPRFAGLPGSGLTVVLTRTYPA